jgi:Flagellar P-ring protein
MISPQPSLPGRRATMQTIKRWIVAAAACAFGMTTLTGCPKPVDPPKAAIRYPVHPPPANMPAFLKGTIHELTIEQNTGDFPVNSYGLVTGLRGTGDSTAPAIVRDWMIKEMQRHGVSSAALGYGKLSPEQMLSDPSVAIVQVVANIPPGARKGDYVDVIVQALPNNNTSSLANGMLYRTALRINGTADPFGAVNEFAKAQGNIFVNPAYAGADSAAATQTALKASLRTGLIPDGGIITTDRPIHLVMRTPSWSTSRSVESRINYRFQTPDRFRDPTALAQDEGYIHLYVPRNFRGDWQHFLGICTHLYMNADHGFLALKAKELAEEAVKPNAYLEDISYCWEAIGEPAVPFITPLLSSPQQEVQYAAARAAAFIGDQFGQDMLVQIARTPGHAFQVNAVRTLGELPDSPLINASLATLLDTNESLVRIEAYKVLAAHHDGHIFSKVIHAKLNPENEFVLDLIASSGPPLIYCSRLGQPRVAIFGRKVAMDTPVVFRAFDSRLTISTPQDRPRTLNIFYRDTGRRTPVEALSSPDLGELVARLGGASDEGFHFTYGDIVAILQSMTSAKQVPAAFVLQPLPGLDLGGHPGEGRPQGNETAAAHGGTEASLPDLPVPVRPKKEGEDKKEKKDKKTENAQNDQNVPSGRPQ